MTTVARRQTARKNEEVVAAGLGQEKVDKGQETAAEYIPMSRYMRCLPYKVLACARTFLPQRLIGCVMSQTSDAIYLRRRVTLPDSALPVRHTQKSAHSAPSRLRSRPPSDVAVFLSSSLFLLSFLILSFSLRLLSLTPPPLHVLLGVLVVFQSYLASAAAILQDITYRLAYPMHFHRLLRVSS